MTSAKGFRWQKDAATPRVLDVGAERRRTGCGTVLQTVSEPIRAEASADRLCNGLQNRATFALPMASAQGFRWHQYAATPRVLDVSAERRRTGCGTFALPMTSAQGFRWQQDAASPWQTWLLL